MNCVISNFRVKNLKLCLLRAEAQYHAKKRTTHRIKHTKQNIARMDMKTDVLKKIEFF